VPTKDEMERGAGLFIEALAAELDRAGYTGYKDRIRELIEGDMRTHISAAPIEGLSGAEYASARAYAEFLLDTLGGALLLLRVGKEHPVP